MIFKETKLKGAFVIELEPMEDERGFFARTFCRKEFRHHGLNPNLVQCNISFNKKKNTLRGMHYQVPPHQETKLISCIGGALYDVIIDLRPNSATYCQWFPIELTGHRSSLITPYKMLYVPEGFAHGFQTLEDNTLVFYQMSEFYHPECSRGMRWNDPAFGIDWPAAGKRIISDEDKSYADLVKGGSNE